MNKYSNFINLRAKAEIKKVNMQNLVLRSCEGNVREMRQTTEGNLNLNAEP